MAIPSAFRTSLQRALKKAGFKELYLRQEIIAAIMPPIHAELQKQWLRGEESAMRFPRGEGG